MKEFDFLSTINFKLLRQVKGNLQITLIFFFKFSNLCQGRKLLFLAPGIIKIGCAADCNFMDVLALVSVGHYISLVTELSDAPC